MNNQKQKIILFEGLDCTGKTTLIERLAKERPCVIVPVKGRLMEIIKKSYNLFKKNPPLNSHLFNHKMRENQIKKLKTDKLIILDRNILTTIAYYSVLLEKDLSYLLKKMKIQPDLIFYLRVNPKSRKKRFGSRKEKGINEEYFQKGKLIDEKYISLLKNFKQAIVIDTSNKSIDQCYKIILKEINKIK